MRRILPVLLAAALAACRSPAPAASPIPAAQAAATGNLIIRYDPAIGAEPLLAAASDYRAEILYRYKIINAIAVKLPPNTDPQQAARHFQTIRGVLSAEPDRVMHLHGE
ncbi:MAG: hypothetical protein Q3966_08345 [Neisseria sp.]|nr:hypothetical protein [Neisseria sp.]